MKQRIVLSTVVPVLILFSGTGLGQEKGSRRADRENPPIPEAARSVCRTIAGILSVYPALEVETSVGAVPGKGTVRHGCRILASGPASGLAGEVPPDEPIRFLLGESGWEEDFRYSAGSPGTTSFALRMSGMLCLFHGGARPGIEDGKTRAAERYEFEAGCAEEPAGTVPGR